MRRGDRSLLGILSFMVLISVAILLVIRWLAPILTISPTICTVLETLQNLLVLIVIGMLAYNFACSYGKGMKVIFWIAATIFLIGIVLLWI